MKWYGVLLKQKDTSMKIIYNKTHGSIHKMKRFHVMNWMLYMFWYLAKVFSFDFPRYFISQWRWWVFEFIVVTELWKLSINVVMKINIKFVK